MRQPARRIVGHLLAIAVGSAGLLTCGGGTEPSVAPSPSIRGLSPDTIITGSPEITLTVTGLHFQSGAEVQWNGSAKATTYGGENQLTALLPAADLDSVSTATVTVSIPGGRISNSMGLPILPPTPTITALLPDTIIAGSPDVTIAVVGHDFDAGAAVRWNGGARPTTFVSATRLDALLPSADVDSVTTGTVTVSSPGRRTSAAVQLLVLNPAPQIDSLAPDSIGVGSFQTTVILHGRHYDSQSLAQWNGLARLTTFLSDSLLAVRLVTGDLDTATTGSVTVIRPNARPSNSRALVVSNATPVIAGVTPPALYAWNQDTTLTITGSGLVFNSVVFWDGTPVTTSLLFGAVTARIPGPQLTTVGPHILRITNPPPGGGTSPAWTYGLLQPPPAPILSQVSPDSLGWGAYSTTVTVRGSRFVPQTEVRSGGQPGATTFISDSVLLTSAPPPVLSQNGGPLQITVVTPVPGGGTSGALPIFVTPPTATPHLRSISPDFALSGSGPLTVTVRGNAFLPTTMVEWDGAPAPSFVIQDDSTAALTVADLGGGGFHEIRMRTAGGPAPRSPETAVFTFAGIGTTSFTTLKLRATSVVSDTVANLLYVGSQSGFLYIVDPALGRVVDSVNAFFGQTRFLAISGDGSKLLAQAGAYLAAADAHNLDLGFTQLLFQVHPSLSLNAIVPLPGTSLSFATLWTSQVLNQVSLIIWDGAVPRPHALDGVLPPIALVAPDTILATVANLGTYLLPVFFDGIQGGSRPSGLQNISAVDYALDGRRLFVSDGEVIGLDARAVIGSVPLQPPSGLSVDQGRQQLLAIGGSTSPALQVFDLATLQPRGAAIGLPVSPATINYMKPFRWGTDGIAYVDAAGYLCILRSPLVGP